MYATDFTYINNVGKIFDVALFSCDHLINDMTWIK